MRVKSPIRSTRVRSVRSPVSGSTGQLLPNKSEAVAYFKGSPVVDTIGKSSRSITLSGTGSIETDYIVKLNLHKGSLVGDGSNQDIFFDDQCRTDFSDIAFYLEDGTRLEHYVHSHGNYEVVQDALGVGEKNFILPNGDILASGVTGKTGLCISTDNGENWAVVKSLADVRMCFVDSLGNAFAFSYSDVGGGYGTHRMLKSAADNTERTVWTVTDLDDFESVDGQLLHTSFCEDSSGNLYCARYQWSFSPAIYKSTDRGDTWLDITPTITSGLQHCHGMHVDPHQSPEAIYSGWDGDVNRAVLKSTDAGETWVDINCPDPANFNQMISGPGFRLFSGEASINGGYTIVRTTDDVNYTPVLQTAQLISGMQWLNGVIYAFGGTNNSCKYAQVLRSTDNGLTWKSVWIADYWEDNSASAGLRYATPAGLPSGETVDQLLIGEKSDSHFVNSRVFDGGSHYQALVFVKVPSLPAAGVDISAVCGGRGVEQSTMVFPQLSHSGLLSELRIDEGSGTTLSDSSVNGKDATLSSASWLDEVGRKVGALVPASGQNSGVTRLASGNKITFDNSDTDPDFAFVKDFTWVIWCRFNIADPDDGTLRFLFGRGSYYNDPLALYVRHSGSVRFRFNNGSSNVHIANFGTGAGYIPKCLFDGGLHMFALTLDDATPPNITCTIDVQDSTPVTLAATPVVGTQRPFTVGDEYSGGFPNDVDVAAVHIYNRALTAKERRQLYESRIFADTEPVATNTGNIVTYDLDIVSGTGPSDWIVKMPDQPELKNILGLDSDYFDAAGVPKNIVWSTHPDNGYIRFGNDNDQPRAVIYNSEQTGDTLTKIDRYIRNT